MKIKVGKLFEIGASSVIILVSSFCTAKYVEWRMENVIINGTIKAMESEDTKRIFRDFSEIVIGEILDTMGDEFVEKAYTRIQDDPEFPKITRDYLLDMIRLPSLKVHIENSLIKGIKIGAKELVENQKKSKQKARLSN
ncbi:hypothetical protein SteCoe_6063 [Stentor coeruleus]|uniref:Uncharacterized protein n=1 Tax=Stentor coeruleus TaxID=5963 RepID=A0A1R2CQX5_9CILI|nr:hypothetical protein SteCoe_6063 [Stentor coeruleus]